MLPEMSEAVLTLMECDIEAQRSFFRTFEFDSCGSHQFSLHVMESDWYDLVSRLIEILPANETKGTGETGRKENMCTKTLTA